METKYPYDFLQVLHCWEIDDEEGAQESQKQQASLPGYPGIAFDDHKGLCDFIGRQFKLEDLEELAPRLWMMSDHKSWRISPLHRQKVKGRDVVITEDPRLHLIWYYDKIFIKPLPEYLLSYRFWKKYLLDPTSPLPAEERHTVRKAALGYLRTWFYLIKYVSDYRIAKDEDNLLVPEDITWERFARISSSLGKIQDDDVALRYSYGEIRLSRLNFYAKLFLGKLNFQRIDAQYGAYFARFYGPILFVFGTFTVVLSAMQVELAAETLLQENHWLHFWLVCRWFSIICLLISVVLSLWLGFLFFFKLIKEWMYAIQEQEKRKN